MCLSECVYHSDFSLGQRGENIIYAKLHDFRSLTLLAGSAKRMHSWNIIVVIRVAAVPLKMELFGSISGKNVHIEVSCGGALCKCVSALCI